MSLKVFVALQQFCESDDAPLRLLADAGARVRRNGSGRRLIASELVRELADSDAVIAGLEPYGAETLASLPALKCISRCGVGVDSIDLVAAKARGVAVLVTADEVVKPVAEMTVAMMLALARELPAQSRDMAQGRWLRRQGYMLGDWTIGLVGFGRIGRATADMLRPFGPRLLVHDPALSPAALPDGAEMCGLDALLARADLVSLHAQTEPGAPPLLGRRELFAMKAGARLVNTARGRLVDEAALQDALTSGRLSAAALDVFGAEPYDGPLARLPQVLATPHVASATASSRPAMELGAARNLLRHFGSAPSRLEK